jgi:nucleoside-diphosphate-sugar epimerase
VSLRGRRVLVTGADGFIGSHLTEALVRAEAEVRAFCFYNSNASLGWLDESPPAVREALDVRLGDVRDARFVEEACRDVDIVFHLAALIAIPYSYTAPESFVDTNVKGTLNVLEGVRRAGCTRMIHTSTSEVYGTPETLPITEGHSLKGQSPYSATKIAADKLCEAYHRSFATPVAILRPFNTFGPRQSARAVIPTILGQLLAGRRRLKLGNVAPTAWADSSRRRRRRALTAAPSISARGVWSQSRRSCGWRRVCAAWRSKSRRIPPGCGRRRAR